MTPIPLGITVLCYWWVAFAHAKSGDYGVALAWFGFGVGNLGFLLAAV